MSHLEYSEKFQNGIKHMMNGLKFTENFCSWDKASNEYLLAYKYFISIIGDEKEELNFLLENIIREYINICSNRRIELEKLIRIKKEEDEKESIIREAKKESIRRESEKESERILKVKSYYNDEVVLNHMIKSSSINIVNNYIDGKDYENESRRNKSINSFTRNSDINFNMKYRSQNSSESGSTASNESSGNTPNDNRINLNNGICVNKKFTSSSFKDSPLNNSSKNIIDILKSPGRSMSTLEKISKISENSFDIINSVDSHKSNLIDITSNNFGIEKSKIYMSIPLLNDIISEEISENKTISVKEYVYFYDAYINKIYRKKYFFEYDFSDNLIDFYEICNTKEVLYNLSHLANYINPGSCHLKNCIFFDCPLIKNSNIDNPEVNLCINKIKKEMLNNNSNIEWCKHNGNNIITYPIFFYEFIEKENSIVQYQLNMFFTKNKNIGIISRILDYKRCKMEIMFKKGMKRIFK